MFFKFASHNFNEMLVVEVFDNAGHLAAVIYPDEASNGIKIVSKHIASFDLDDGRGDCQRFVLPGQIPTDVPAVMIQFLRKEEA